MDRKLVMLLTSSLLALITVFVTTGLQEKTYDTKMDHVNAAVGQAEKDMGNYDEQTASTTPAIKRAIQLSRQMNKKMDASQQLLDSLAHADEQDLGGEDAVISESENGEGSSGE